VPCDDILGVVVYDLPGRDCAAKASNGELAVGEVARYKSEFIDRAFDPTLVPYRSYFKVLETCDI
jgi:cellulase/cellobiase CelA1